MRNLFYELLGIMDEKTKLIIDNKEENNKMKTECSM